MGEAEMVQRRSCRYCAILPPANCAWAPDVPWANRDRSRLRFVRALSRTEWSREFEARVDPDHIAMEPAGMQYRRVTIATALLIEPCFAKESARARNQKLNPAVVKSACTLFGDTSCSCSWLELMRLPQKGRGAYDLEHGQNKHIATSSDCCWLLV